MMPKGKRGMSFDRSGMQAAAASSGATGASSTLYVYETHDINANPQANTGNLLNLALGDGSPGEILFRLAQQFPGSRCFVYSLESEEFQGWKEITEKNVKSLGENLRVRNQLKVVKQSSLMLAFHESEFLDRLVSTIVERLKKGTSISEVSSMEDGDIQIMDDVNFNDSESSPHHQLSEGEQLCLTDQEPFSSQNWAKVRERARGVLHLQYP
ncbi:hypothetical protein MPTK2_4g07020 [Marchantia polymorpha subsp. ruderalis]